MSRDTTVIAFRQPDAIDDPLSELAREGARRMLAQVLIAEADSFVALWKDLKLPDGRDRVVRHGHGGSGDRCSKLYTVGMQPQVPCRGDLALGKRRHCPRKTWPRAVAGELYREPDSGARQSSRVSHGRPTRTNH